MKKSLGILLFFLFVPCMVVQAEWKQDFSGRWSYTTEAGLVKGQWRYINNQWYFFDSDGVMQTGWLSLGNQWYYLNSSGAMQTGWVHDEDEDGCYYLDSTGLMRVSWVYTGDKWYYLNKAGKMQTGWVDVNDKSYYLSSSGAMLASQWYSTHYLDDTGAMLTGAFKDGYYLDSNGERCLSTISSKYKVSYKTHENDELITIAEELYSKYKNQIHAVVELVNLLREEYNNALSEDSDKYLDDLNTTDALNLAACHRAAEMASQKKKLSARPDGTSYTTILDNYGISYSVCAESELSGEVSVEAIYTALAETSKYKNVYKSTSYKNIGVGLCYDAAGKAYWAILYY